MDEVTKNLIRELMRRISLSTQTKCKQPSKIFEEEDFVKFFRSHELQIKWVKKNNKIDINYKAIPEVIGQYLDRITFLEVDDLIRDFLKIRDKYEDLATNTAISQFVDKHIQYLEKCKEKAKQMNATNKSESIFDLTDQVSMNNSDSGVSESVYISSNDSTKFIDQSGSLNIDSTKSSHRISITGSPNPVIDQPGSPNPVIGQPGSPNPVIDQPGSPNPEIDQTGSPNIDPPKSYRISITPKQESKDINKKDKHSSTSKVASQKPSRILLSNPIDEIMEDSQSFKSKLDPPLKPSKIVSSNLIAEIKEDSQGYKSK